MAIGQHQMARRRLRLVAATGEAGVVLWMVAAFVAALVLAGCVLAVLGTAQRGTSIALQLTGRLSLLLFWPAYAGGAMARLFGRRFEPLARHGRDFGLAYASAQLVHIGLVAHIIAITDPLTIQSIMPFFAVGVVWTYLLAFLSMKPIENLLAPGFGRILRNIGLEYLALVFLADLVVRPFATDLPHVFAYLPFSLLIAAGPMLRLAARLRQLPLLPAAWLGGGSSQHARFDGG
jgi:hypothetical protein